MRVCPGCAAVYREDVAFCGVDGTKLVDQPDDPLLGQTVDRYQVIERIGSGGMGTVYRAVHKNLGSMHAIKVLAGEFAANRTVVERFKREARSIGKLSHPNVVSVSAFGTTKNGLSFLVMEIVEGVNLKVELDRSLAFPRARAISITRQLASGLGAAHRAGLVHRDLKPSNVMLTNAAGFEFVKVLDFGVVLSMEGDDEEQKLTRTGRLMGTPGYMAPEQAMDLKVTPKTDLYALGVILYEMLAGETMFRESNQMQLLVRHVTETPLPLPDCGGLEDLAMWLLEKDPDDRPSDAEAVIGELDRLSSRSKRTSRPFVRSVAERSGTDDVPDLESIDIVQCGLADEIERDAAHDPPLELRPKQRVNRRIGDLLLEMNVIKPTDLDAALERQRQQGGRLGRALVALGAITETRLIQALSRQLALDIWQPTGRPVHPRVLAALPREIMQKHQVLPVALSKQPTGDRLHVAALDPLDDQTKAAVTNYLTPGRQLVWLLTTESDLRQALLLPNLQPD